MRFFFIRHGQSENNLLWAKTGASNGRFEDPELTPTGLLQARSLADFIAQKDEEQNCPSNQEVSRDCFHFTHLYTSLMVRSVKTASILSEILDIPFLAWPEIHECGGIYLDDDESKQVGLPGRTRSYYAQNYRSLVLPETVTDAGWYNRPYETEEERPLRARLVLETLLELHGGTEDNVAIVSHGGFYMEFVRVLLGIPKGRSWFHMNNTGVSRFDFWGENGVRLFYHNRTDHLESQYLT
jgi:2,3-bisphosphoglycerate-dependent phosphoglycerate mutase